MEAPGTLVGRLIAIQSTRAQAQCHSIQAGRTHYGAVATTESASAEEPLFGGRRRGIPGTIRTHGASFTEYTTYQNRAIRDDLPVGQIEGGVEVGGRRYSTMSGIGTYIST